MSIKANSIIGLPVITITDGKNISTIKDVVYNGVTNQVTAFVVDEKGWFNVAKIILIQDVKSIGKDAVLIEDESKIVTADNQVDQNIAFTANSNNFLDTNTVITQGGTKLGKVTDIYFNENTGKLEAIEVSEGFLKDMVSGTKKIEISDIITIGVENLIVHEDAKKSLEEQSQQQGINKLMEDAKATSMNVAAQAGNKIQEVSEAVKSKSEEIINSEQVQNTLSKTQELATNAKNSVSEAFVKTKESIESGEAEAKLKDTTQAVKDKVVDAAESAKDKISNVTNNLKDKASNVSDEVENQVESGEAEAKLKDTAETAQYKISNATENVKDKISDMSDIIVSQGQSVKTEIKNKIMEDKTENILGKVIIDDVTIYGINDRVIAYKGQVVTSKMLQEAKDNDVLDNLLESV